jgi:copper chaperone
MEYQIIVENIKCGGCMNSIKTNLLKAENVATVAIDKANETVIINTLEPTDRITLVNQLAQMGYPERGNNNLLLKAKSFVSCAIGRMTEDVNV